MADEDLETPLASDDIARFWHATAFDLGRRQQLLARALAAGRPVGMKSWAREGKQDTEITDAVGRTEVSPAVQINASEDTNGPDRGTK